MKNQVVEVIVVQEPTKAEAEQGVEEQIVYGPKTVLAPSTEAASFKAIAKIVAENPNFPVDQARVLVRPF